jgi:hypothetical protein
VHNIDMRVSLVVILLLATVASPAHAQEAASPPLDTFLEQRVAEELAADGILLSRLGVTLDVEQVGDKLLVSLIDVSTGRVSASTKIDEVPADRDAAVASVTVVVSNLTVQLAGPKPTVQPPSAAPVDPDASRNEAEYEYRQQAIGFGEELLVTDEGRSVSRDWTAHQGELRLPLTGAQFYEAIDRPDLAKKYQRRRTLARRSLVVVGASVASMAVFMAVPLIGDHDGFDTQFKIAGAGTVISLISAFVAFGYAHHYAHTMNPVSESEAKQLAEQHNQRLRERLGLPNHVSVAPYVSGQGGGLSLAGQF